MNNSVCSFLVAMALTSCALDSSRGPSPPQLTSADFKPVPLEASATFRVRNAVRRISSRNVIAKIDGSDPALRGEAVVYTAHWDHLGWDQTLPGPKRAQVYHGAIDNASGVAMLLEVARAFRALPRAPRRSIVFIATTSEEQQMLGRSST